MINKEKLLTFEFSKKREALEIHFNKEGLEELINYAGQTL